MGLTNRIQQMLVEEAKRKRLLLSANLELLPVCNLDCKMCYVRTSMSTVKKLGGLKRLEEWLELARQLRNEGTLFLLLTGGEVFLYPGFKKLYIELYKMGFIITINTNATLIDEEVIDWLKQYPPKCVSISLYGASEATYERLCGAKGMFERVKHAITLLMENHIRFELKTIFSPLNISDIVKCCAMGGKLGVFHEMGFYAFPPARRVDRESQIRFSPEQVVDYTFEKNRMLSSENGFKKDIVEHLRKYEFTKNRPGDELYGFTCGATRSSCWITWRGHMTPCAMLEEPYTMPFEQGIHQAWEGLKKTCDGILMASDCSHCDKREMCTTCPAANFAESGSFQKKSEYHCRMTEKTLEDMYRMVDEWGIDLQQIISRKEDKP